MQSIERNRRGSQRAPCAAPVRISLLPPPPASAPRYLLPIDISETGLRLADADVLPVGSSVTLDLEIEDAAPPVRAIGQVVWTAEDPVHMLWQSGIRFTDVPERARAMLRAYVDRQRHLASWRGLMPELPLGGRPELLCFSACSVPFIRAAPRPPRRPAFRPRSGRSSDRNRSS